MNKKSLLTYIALTSCACVSTAFAQTTIFSDSFSRTGSLNGSTTEVGGLTWTAAAGYTTDGSELDLTGSSFRVATVPITLGSDIYTLTASINVDDASSGNAFHGLGIGFVSSASTTQDIRNDISLIESIADRSLSYISNVNVSNTSASTSDDPIIEISVILDTTGTDWEVEYLYNGTISLSTHTITGGDPSISHIALGSIQGADGSFDNVSLTTTAIPEPKAYALLFSVVACVGLVLRKRRIHQ